MTINDLFRFWLDLPGKGLTQVFPFNSQLKFVDKRKTGYRFHQRTLENPLILIDEPEENNFGFTYLMDLERQGLTCEKVDITIDMYCDCGAGYWVDAFYKGYLRLNAGEWSVSECKVTIPIVVQDKFTCLTTSWSNDVNMFDYGDPTIQISPFIGVIQKVECGPEAFIETWYPAVSTTLATTFITLFFLLNQQSDCLADNPPGNSTGVWTQIKHTYVTNFNFIPEAFNPIFPSNTYTLQAITQIKTEWAREFVAGLIQPDGNGWVAVTGGFARPISAVSLPTLDHTTSEGLLALEAEWGGDNFSIGMLMRNNIIGEDANGNSTFANGKELGPLLEDLLAPCELTVVSNFLNINPDATAPANDYYTRAAEDFHGIIIYQISDVARIDETESATIGLMRLKDLLDALKVAGNLDVDIDGSILRIEHLSYWPDTVQMDLTLPDFLYLIKDKWKYTYDQESQPKVELIGWDSETDGKGNDFDGYPIEYDNACVNDQEDKIDKTTLATGYLTNLFNIIGNEDFYDDTERFVMISTKNLVINSALQPISGYNKLNGNLAMGYLLPRYYDYGRPFKEGMINKILTPFYSSKRLRLQAPITIPFACDDYLNNYTPSGLVKTQLGAGEIESATYIVPDNSMEFKLRHK